MEILCINLKASKLNIFGGQAPFLQEKTDFFKAVAFTDVEYKFNLIATGISKVATCHIWNKAKKNLHYFCKTLYRTCFTSCEYGCGPEYTSVVDMALILNMTGFWIFQGTEYARVLNIPRLRRLLNVSEYPWIIPEYA